MATRWFLDKDLLSDRLREFTDILDTEGDSYELIGRWQRPKECNPDEPNFILTTCNNLRNYPYYCIYDNNSYDVNYWSHTSDLLNEYKVNTWRMLSETENIFIRPISGNKSFSGFVNKLNNHPNIAEHELCVWDYAREIDPVEYRCWVIDGKPRMFATYSLDPDIILPLDIPDKVISLASKVSKQNLPFGDSYVVDICFSNGFNGVAKVVEFNAISTSGLYNVDLQVYYFHIKAHLEKQFYLDFN